MIDKIKVLTLTLLLTGFAYANDDHAEDANTVDANTTAPAKTTPQSAYPKNWWQMGSYEYPQTDEVLIHLQGNLSYTKKNGNEEDEALRASVFAKVRKNHWGLSFSYAKTKEDTIAYGDKDTVDPTTLTRDEYSLNWKLGYDINEDFYLTAGYSNARDLEFEIYNQTTRYIGVGYRVLKTPRHKLNVFAALGDEDISFGTYPQLPSGRTNGKYYEINYLGFITPTVLFKSSYQYLQADMEDRDTATFTVATKFSITDHVAFVVSYMDQYIEAQQTVNRYEHDQTLFTSIEFDF